MFSGVVIYYCCQLQIGQCDLSNSELCRRIDGGTLETSVMLLEIPTKLGYGVPGVI